MPVDKQRPTPPATPHPAATDRQRTVPTARASDGATITNRQRRTRTHCLCWQLRAGRPAKTHLRSDGPTRRRSRALEKASAPTHVALARARWGVGSVPPCLRQAPYTTQTVLANAGDRPRHTRTLTIPQVATRPAHNYPTPPDSRITHSCSRHAPHTIPVSAFHSAHSEPLLPPALRG